MNKVINIVGAGLAGCEAAYQCAKRGLQVNLYEMRPVKMTPAHQTGDFAELVCSNSLRSNELTNAVGLLKEEMRTLDSIIMRAADKTMIPAGSALAVDRDLFSKAIEEELLKFDNITMINQEVTSIPEGLTIIASGPLTSDDLSESIRGFFDEESLSFFDAVAPIIEYDSINMNIAYKKSRYDKGTADYINCPMTREQFMVFYNELINAKTVELKDFEDEKVFEGCMPVEVMAKRGIKTLTFGPLKPVGLAKDNEKPFAVVQLRQDDVAGNLYNIVGFQTHLTWSEQKRVIQLIPGLENAKIVRYGVMHRNTYLKSPRLINKHYQTLKRPDLFFAGQITGVEGYVESAASGLLAALNAIHFVEQLPLIDFGNDTMIGSMSNYISHGNADHFQPMNANFGIMNSSIKDKKERAENALDIIKQYE